MMLRRCCVLVMFLWPEFLEAAKVVDKPRLVGFSAREQATPDLCKGEPGLLAKTTNTGENDGALRIES